MVKYKLKVVNEQTGEIDIENSVVDYTVRNEMIDEFLKQGKVELSVDEVKSELHKIITYKISKYKESVYDSLVESEDITEEVIETVKSLEKLKDKVEYGELLDFTIKDLFQSKLISFKDYLVNDGVYSFIKKIIKGY